MADALASIAGFIALMSTLATQAMGFSPEPFARAGASGAAQTAALIIAFLAGVSEMLGQSVVLVVNRVALYRFLASLAFTGATYALTVLTWAVAALAIAPVAGSANLSPGDLAGVVGVLALAFAPRLLGVFSIAPYFGVALGNLLEVWSMTLAIFGLHVAFGLPVGAAVICGGAGFIVSYLFRTFFGRVLIKPLGRLRHAVAGSPLDKSPRQLVDDIFARLSDEAPR